jgi:DNA polymerase I-like protein with 3'-5' exonuclease and polymerase domains
VATVHDEIVVECDENDAEKVKAWLKKAMVDGMDEVLDGAGSPHVPVEVETRVARTWAG